MHPVILGPLKSYGLMLAISFAVGIWIAARRGRSAGMKVEDVYDLSFVILISSLVGVRLAYVLTHLSEFAGQWHRVVLINEGGLTLYGGILGAGLASVIFCRRRKLAFLTTADVMVPSVALGIGITRIGCFLAGCCYGKPCDLPWAVHFPHDAPASLRFGDLAVHPSQLYGSAGGFLIFALLLLWERQSHRPGETIGRFLVLYGVQRFAVDFSRYYEASQRLMFGWSNNQWLSLALIVLGLGLLVRAARRPAAA
ncbi:MAG: prolipoprotein diacylglyceryl transferase [Candidatus Krumholzibacteriia bacterium]